MLRNLLCKNQQANVYQKALHINNTAAKVTFHPTFYTLKSFRPLFFLFSHCKVIADQVKFFLKFVKKGNMCS